MSTVLGRNPWDVSQQDFPSILPIQIQLTYLLQYAILAPSSKNTQPWKFSVAANRIGVFADLTRWQPVADRDRRELYISLGCALENLLVAAKAFGFRTEVCYFPQPSLEELAATVTFYPAAADANCCAESLLHSITARHTQRGLYLEEPIAEELRARLLEHAGAPDLRLDLTDHPRIRARVLDLNLHADEMEFADPSFRKELGYWVGRGAFGTPRLLARPIGLLLARLNLGRIVGKRNAEILSSAPLIGLIGARRDDRISWLHTGQLLERLWLHATRLGIALQPMSQALEIPSLRAELARALPAEGWIPQQLFRLGYPLCPEKRRTPRLPLGQVLLG